jgi:hypothetical protein
MLGAVESAHAFPRDRARRFPARHADGACRGAHLADGAACGLHADGGGLAVPAQAWLAILALAILDSILTRQ